ncbi:hypothetical protein D9M72_617530 [compost metagenome]
MRRVGADFVVLDEVHARGAEPFNECGSLRGGEPHVRLDDRADQRAARHTRGAPRARDADARHLELRAIGRRHMQRFEPQPRHFTEVIEVA